DLSLPTWIDQQAAVSRTELATIEEQIATLRATSSGHSLELAAAEYQRGVHIRRAERFEGWSPWAHDWLPKTPFETLLVVCGGVLICTLIKNIFRVINAMVVARLGCRGGLEMRKIFYQNLLRLDLAKFNQQGRGDLLNRCTGDLNSISLGVQTLFGLAVREPLKMFACIAGAAFVSWRL